MITSQGNVLVRNTSSLGALPPSLTTLGRRALVVLATFATALVQAGSAGRPSDGPDSPVPQDAAAALFAADNESLMLARRTLRLRELPPLPRPPAGSENGHPIDGFIADLWRRSGLEQAAAPPPLCDDATFARRVYLDLIGVVPTIEERERFVRDSGDAKRDRLVDELLARDSDYAANWTPFWEDALGSSTTSLQGGIPTRGDYREWVFNSFKNNRPFDVMVAELIDPGMPGHRATVLAEANTLKSQVGFIRNDSHVNTLQTAANIGQVFLGTSMKCASCHSHFLNIEWPQKRFLAFAGLCGPNDLEVIRCEKQTGDLAAAEFPFAIPGAPQDVPTGEAPRLRRLAQLLTDPQNPRFARTTVNRLWKRYLGLGLYEPVDDLRDDRSPSHPELLDWLAHDFMTHGYDLKHTIRLILTSHAYQRRYDPALAEQYDPAAPDRPRYHRSPTLRRLTAEQLIDSVRLAARQRSEPASRTYLDKTSSALTRALGKPASRNEISTARPDDVAVVQGLELLNGEDYALLVTPRQVARLAPRGTGAAQAVERIYAATVGREPSPAELNTAIRYVDSAQTDSGMSPSGAPAPQPNTPGPGPEVADTPPSGVRALPDGGDVLWFDDEIPAGATVGGSGMSDSLQWTTRGEGPVYSGSRSHRQRGSAAPRAQHFFLGASTPLEAGPDDLLTGYVYIDPADPPREIMLQWHTDGWEHRAYWGEDLIPFGSNGTASRWPMGRLPDAGRWVRLEVEAGDVSVSGAVVGISFDQAGGTVYWDASGLTRRTPDPRAAAMHDLFWALVTSPEFQYIR